MNERKNQKKQAVALSYDPESDHAPKVTAKGTGEIAKNIIETARNNSVPIQEDESLVELLSQINLNDTIPEELYRVVAELFAFIYELEKKVEQKGL
jgi:flagellar biosynthesis protein